MTAGGNFRCANCGRFISYIAITKEHDGCFNCVPNATHERRVETILALRDW